MTGIYGGNNWWASLPISGSFNPTYLSGVTLRASGGYIFGCDDKDYDLGIDGKEPSVKFIKDDRESND
jgi:hypothetical protein